MPRVAGDRDRERRRQEAGPPQMPQPTPGPPVYAPYAAAPVAARSNQGRGSIGIVGICITVIGIVGLVVSLTAVDWIHFNDIDFSGDSYRFTARDIADDPTSSGFASAFCGWLGWVLLAATGALSLGACVPSGARGGLRVAAVLVGAGSVIVLLWAMATLDPGNDLVRVLKQASAGLYIAVFSFLVIALGGATGELGTTTRG